MASRRFTLEEANALIPRLEMLMERLQRTALVGAKRRARSARPSRRAHDGRRAAGSARACALHVEEIESTVAEIEQLGVAIQGTRSRTGRFSCGEIDGRPVLLCWQYGEKSIGFWHAIDEGFAGRRALPTRDGAAAAVGAPACRRSTIVLLPASRWSLWIGALVFGVVRGRARRIRRRSERDRGHVMGRIFPRYYAFTAAIGRGRSASARRGSVAGRLGALDVATWSIPCSRSCWRRRPMPARSSDPRARELRPALHA